MWNQLNEALEQSARRIISTVAGFLPGVLAMLLAVLVALPLAWLVARIVRRSLGRLRVDDRLAQWGFAGLADWSPSNSPSLLISRILYWTILLFGLLVGLTAFNADLTSRLSMQAFEYLPRVFVAAGILLVGSFIARYLARGVLVSAVNLQIHSARLMSLGVKWLILVLTAAMALDHLGIGGSIVRLAFAILFGGIVLALALAVGLGSKDAVSRSLERRESRTEEEPVHPFRHL
jgi:Mechanosensitive ion channel, conserved TM helix